MTTDGRRIRFDIDEAYVVPSDGKRLFIRSLKGHRYAVGYTKVFVYKGTLVLQQSIDFYKRHDEALLAFNLRKRLKPLCDGVEYCDVFLVKRS